MVIFRKVNDIKGYLAERKKDGSSIGFVPTMGALHQGHLSLVRQSKSRGLLTVCSVFVNPTQFNDKKDLEKYPVTAEEDITLLLGVECDVLFMPSVTEIYPGGFDNMRAYDFGYLDTILEGAKRPGHFKGVGQVVGRLLEIVEPGELFLGQKDYQQCMVIKRLAELMGLTDLKINICPTTREEDGLAMSSRNRRLTDPQRTLAAVIYQCLVSIQSKQDDDFAVVKKECEELLANKGFETEYVALANAENLELLNDYRPGIPMVALIAAKMGEIRLIDNMLL
jgi:pantoate--beta-alanine ligase